MRIEGNLGPSSWTAREREAEDRKEEEDRRREDQSDRRLKRRLASVGGLDDGWRSLLAGSMRGTVPIGSPV